MKILILGLFIWASAALAYENDYGYGYGHGYGYGGYANVQPTLVNLGDRIQVQIHNDSDYAVWCTGVVYLILDSGERETQYYSGYVGSQMMTIGSIYTWERREGVASFKSDIYCHY